jgi:Domain of unknown function (DUF4260)
VHPVSATLVVERTSTREATVLPELVRRTRPAALVVAEHVGNGAYGLGHPSLQRPDVGDVLLEGADCDADHGAWTVRLIEPGRSLVLFSSRTLDGREVDPGVEPKPRPYIDRSWAFVLVPDGDAPTCLLVRGRLLVEQATRQQAAATGVAGVLSSSGLAVALAMAWFAHTGMDRALGLGLQYPDGSGRTHLRRARRASNHPGLGGGAWTG